MANEKEAQLAKELLDAVNKAIEEGAWGKGLLFETIGKKLREIRDEIQEDFLSNIISSTTADSDNNATVLPLETVDVFLSLYMLEGNDVAKWEKLLSNLASNIVTRPIYRKEEEIRKAIRAKDNKINDAYACVRIKVSDIIVPPDNRPPADRYGHELLILRQGAITSNSIRYFVHQSGRYLFKDGILIRQGNEDFSS